MLSFQTYVEKVKLSINELSVSSLLEGHPSNWLVIDVRESAELQAGKIPNAICLSRGVLESQLTSLVNIMDTHDKSANANIMDTHDKSMTANIMDTHDKSTNANIMDTHDKSANANNMDTHDKSANANTMDTLTKPTNTQTALDWLEDQNIVLYCRSGARSALAAQSLQTMGLKHVYSLRGGWEEWIRLGYPIEKLST